MGQFAKHIYIQNSAGAIQAVNLYSTAGEAGPWRIRGANVDGQDAYIPCVPYDSTEARRTSAVFTNGAGTWRFATVGTPAYGAAYYSGSGSFTVPDGVTVLRVTCVGGGAGALCYFHNGNSGEVDNAWNANGGISRWVILGNGGATSVGGVVANGATGNRVYAKLTLHENCDSDGYCNSQRYVEYQSPTVGGGGNWGGSYGYGYHAGAGGYNLTNIYGTVYGYAGAGGGGGGDHNNNTVYTITGSSGYIVAGTIGVSPGSVLPVTVGGGGWAWFDTSAYACEGGSSGAALIEWGQGIQ